MINDHDDHDLPDYDVCVKRHTLATAAILAGRALGCGVARSSLLIIIIVIIIIIIIITIIIIIISIILKVILCKGTTNSLPS